MRKSLLFKLLVPLFVFVFIFSAVQPAASAPSEEKVRVWVTFEKGFKDNVKNSLNGAGAEFHYEFDDLDSVVVSMPVQAIDGLTHNPHVLAIEEDVQRYPMEQAVPYGIGAVQATTVQETGVTGSGITVCVIDSGLYTGHEDFNGAHISGGTPTGWNTDQCGHGTHVAGTIAAQNNSLGVVGVAPDVNLYIVKVFGENCAWTYSSTLVDAANKCKAAGAKVISMSLGGSTKSTTEKNAFDSLYSSGILSIAAAGNDGTTALSYPAGYSSVMSVAAVDSNNAWASFSQYNSDVEIAAPGVGVLSTVPYLATDTVTVGGTTYKGIHVEYAAYGTASGALVDGGLCGTTNSAWNGKVVLCQRGTYDFVVKVTNVEKSGGVATVIYNNVEGALNATLGEGNSSSIPAIGITMADGQALVTKVGSSADVVSTIQWNTSGYELYDGTSMATPHVSGVAALIWSANPSWTNAQIRTALTSTALDLGATGKDNYYGYGLVQAKAALDYLRGSSSGGTLNVTVATNKASYVNRETATITVTVKDQNGAAVSGATVSTTIITPNGTKTTYSGTTNTSGVVTISYKISTSKTGTGTYTVSSTATKTGYTSGTGTKTFTVTK